MTESISFGKFVDLNYIEGTDLFKYKDITNTSNKILEEYKEIIITQIINQFGLSKILQLYKNGGNVTTLNNANNNTFAKQKDELRFNKKFDRKDYETNVYDKNIFGKVELQAAGLSTLRFNTEKYKNNIIQSAPDVMNIKRSIPSLTDKNKIKVSVSKSAKNQIDDFMSKSVDKNNRIIDGYNKDINHEHKHSHIDHIASALEIDSNKELKLYMTDKERAILALSNENLTYTYGSANQSKSSKDLIEWSNSKNKKNPNMTNKEFYNLNERDIQELSANSKKFIGKQTVKAKRDYYMKETAKSGMKQGMKVGLQQMIGIFLYELQNEFTTEMKKYLENYKSYKTFKVKIQKFKELAVRIKDNMLKKKKTIFMGFSDGFLKGFISNLITIIVNTFITTSKRVVKLISETFNGIVDSLKILLRSDDGSETSEIKFKAASKLFASTVIGAIGGILTENLIIYLKTTPFAIFSELIGMTVGGILTSITIANVLYLIEDFRGFISSIKDIFKKDEFTQRELNLKYIQISEKIESEYQSILRKIINEYNYLKKITYKAFDETISSEVRLTNTAEYALEFNVNTTNVVENENDINGFFLN